MKGLDDGVEWTGTPVDISRTDRAIAGGNEATKQRGTAIGTRASRFNLRNKTAVAELRLTYRRRGTSPPGPHLLEDLVRGEVPQVPDALSQG